MKINLFYNRKKSGWLLIFIIMLSVLGLNSSFINLSSSYNLTCDGPFYKTNILGPDFSIGVPSTGAPDNINGTCNKCHSTYADNSGLGLLKIEVGENLTDYVPGTVYPVKVTLTHPSIIAMDFQATLRDNYGSQNDIGKIILTNNLRTKLTDGNFGGPGVTYIEGTACGIDVLSPGYNQWTFDWRAPKNSIGEVTF
jgi:hypothetical protein